jgi:hypothetical protein
MCRSRGHQRRRLEEVISRGDQRRSPEKVLEHRSSEEEIKGGDQQR